MSKYKVGDKFIVEIEEIYNGDLAKHEEHMHLHRIKGFNSLVLDEYGLDKLQQINPKLMIEDIDDMLAEHDLKKESYEKGLNDAWELARKVSHMCLDDMNKCFDLEDLDKYGADIMLYEHFTPQEAFAKIEAYEKSQQIQVGDVVEHYGEPVVVTRISKCGKVVNGFSTGGFAKTYRICECTKTGRHIDIEHLLEQIRGNE